MSFIYVFKELAVCQIEFSIHYFYNDIYEMLQQIHILLLFGKHVLARVYCLPRQKVLIYKLLFYYSIHAGGGGGGGGGGTQP